MKSKARFPLLAKVAAWLAVHLLVLALAFYVFVSWQLRLGLDSLLSGATGDRLTALGDLISQELHDSPESEWDALIRGHVEKYGIEAYIAKQGESPHEKQGFEVPKEILIQASSKRPPAPMPPPRDRKLGPPGERLPGERPPGERPPDGLPPRNRLRQRMQTEVLFLTKDKQEGNYWAAMDISLSGRGARRPQQGILFLKSETASANGLFFDYRPWLFGGLAVLALSIVLWIPFVLGITRYAGRISRASARIAGGNFDTKIGARRNDELGLAGESIEEMSAQLGNLISGQKRFLGDVAHELCAPLSRMRTGLGILQTTAEGKQAERIDSIDEDAEELSTLVGELLAFTKANSSPVNIEVIPLIPLLEDLARRELPGHELDLKIPKDLKVKADPRFLTRALLNILRNCHRHGGENCDVRISAKQAAESVSLSIEDNGPGAPEAELNRLFEPFYRPDRSRTRDTGGTGLGMAIVESSIRACGGKVSAEKSAMGGLLVRVSLPKG